VDLLGTNLRKLLASAERCPAVLGSEVERGKNVLSKENARSITPAL